MEKASSTFGCDPSSVGTARDFVREVLLQGGVSEPTEEAVVLLVSEVATNAVVHARSPLGVAVEVDDDTVKVGVSDEDPHMPSPSQRDLDEGGFGLSDWTVEVTPTGKTVWFSVPRYDDEVATSSFGKVAIGSA